MLSAACALALVASSTVAQAVDRVELEAAIVYNILGFVDWPPEAAPPPNGRLVLCVRAGSPLAAPLKALQGRPVHGVPFELREWSGRPVDLRRCHALFLDPGASRPDDRGAPLLVIADGTAGGGDTGATVQLHEADDRIGFDVDLAAARQARLQISSRLLRLARKVTE
jgi:hypothetical protein